MIRATALSGWHSPWSRRSAAFTVKYEVQDLEDQLVAINKQIGVHEEAIHVLSAEWSYLNRPERLAELAQRYLDLVPMNPKQMASLDDVPLRETPAGDGRPPTRAAAPWSTSRSSRSERRLR